MPADEVTVHLSVTSTVDEQLTPAPVLLIDTVSVVLTVDEATTTDSFTYDAAGRMLTRDVDGTETALTWDASSNLTSTTADGVVTVYAYDAGGQRVAQATLAAGGDPGSASVYVAGMELTDPDTAVADDMTGTRFYTFGGATVAVRTAQGLSLLLGDEQGSAQIMMPLHTDSNGALLPATQADADATERTAYAPYGARRGEDLENISRGWLGQVEDTGTGLTYLNARYYDPTIGRFLSPDPLMNPGDPRTLDPYRYADNNPVSFDDVLGLCPGCSVAQVALYGAQTMNVLHKLDANYVASLRKQVAMEVARSKVGRQPLSQLGQAAKFIANAISLDVRDADAIKIGELQARYDGMSATPNWLNALVAGGSGRSGSVSSNAGDIKPVQYAYILDNFCQTLCRWDYKPKLRDHFGLAEANDYWLDPGGTRSQDLYYDVLGNIHFGYLMAEAGIPLEEAIGGAEGGGVPILGELLAGKNDSGDNFAVTLAYQLQAQHPHGQITGAQIERAILQNWGAFDDHNKLTDRPG